MRRSDDIFFFTLIDFLLQISFFGIFLFVVWETFLNEKQNGLESQNKQIEKALKAAGVSNITELNDLLTRLAPVDKLRGTADFIARLGGPEKVQIALKAIEDVGGLEKILVLKSENEALSQRLEKLEGWGKVSCLPNVLIGGKSRPKTIATAIVSDDAITLEDPSPEMLELLNSLGLGFDAVKRLRLSDFRATFSPIVTKRPECRYFLAVRRETRFYEPMEVVWSAFRTL
jgi:hypothetical protein